MSVLVRLRPWKPSSFVPASDSFSRWCSSSSTSPIAGKEPTDSKRNPTEPTSKRNPTKPTSKRKDANAIEVDSQKVLTEISDEGVENYPRFQKPFVDKMWMECKAGNGGDPAPGATRNYHVHKGPAYGGHGGAVYLKSTIAIDNFVDLAEKTPVRHGGDGYKTHRGLHGKDVIIQVPLGTIIRERIFIGERTPEGRKRCWPKFRYQLLTEGEHHLIAKGGIGGIGPRSFKKNDGRRGTPGERKRLELELRVMTDICLIGAPNSGKSALLAALSRTTTRIGPEEYSTTRPHTGALRYRDGVVYKITDLPGVNEGAREDRARGIRTLRHTYRARMLLFIIDVTVGDPLKQLEMLQEEAFSYDPRNAAKPFIVVGSKCDALHKDALFNLDSLYYRLQARQGHALCIGTSSRFGLGILRLVRSIRSLMEGTLGPAHPRVPGRTGYDTLSTTKEDAKLGA